MQRINKIFKFIVTEFLFNGHLQSLGSAGVVFISSYLIMGNPPSIWILITIYLMVQIVFIFDRYRGFKLDKSGNSERSQHLQSYLQKIPHILVLMTVFWLLLLFSLENFYSWIMLTLILIFGILYPIYFKNLTKKIFIFKNLYVAGVYSILVFYPLVHFSMEVSVQIILLAIVVLLENVYSQILLDLKYIHSDKTEGLKTFPVIYGFKNSINFVFFGSLITNIIFIILTVILGFSTLFYTIIVMNLLITSYTYIRFQKDDKTSVTPLLIIAAKCFLWFCVAVGFVILS